MRQYKVAPLIGITCMAEPRNKDYSDYELVCDHRYASVVKNAGGHPVLLPIAHRRDVMSRYIEGIDGLVIVGGDDVDPRLYGEKPAPMTKVVFERRTSFETMLYHKGKKLGLPILGICYGMQLINVLEGGTLYQHLQPGTGSPPIEHQGIRQPTHSVVVQPGTRLHEILSVTSCEVVTGHHQAVCKLAKGFFASAHAPDGVIEAIEHPDLPQVIAVQWHPEQAPHRQNTQRLFRAFVDAASLYHARWARRPTDEND